MDLHKKQYRMQMNFRTHPLYFLVAFCVSFLFNNGLQAQSEAQSGEEFLEFQRVDKPRRPVRVLPGDQVVYPVETADRSIEFKGEVVSTTDSSIVVLERETNRKAELNLNTISYVKHVKRGRRVAGWILVGLGIAYSILSLLVVVVAASIAGPLGVPIGLLLVLSLFLSPPLWVFYGIGIPLVATATKRLDRFNWRWRLVRKVLIKKKAQP